MDFFDSRGDALRVPLNVLFAAFACALLVVGIHSCSTGSYAGCLEGLRAAMVGASGRDAPSQPGSGFAYAGTLLMCAEYFVAFALAGAYSILLDGRPAQNPERVWPLADSRAVRGVIALLDRIERRSSIASNGASMLIMVTAEEAAFRLLPLWFVPAVLGISSPFWLAFLFWASAASFAAVHLPKFVGGLRRPYPCLPQFVGGVTHGYVFLTYGFVAVVAYHWVFNAALATWSDSWEEFG